MIFLEKVVKLINNNIEAINRQLKQLFVTHWKTTEKCSMEMKATKKKHQGSGHFGHYLLWNIL